MQVRLIFPFVLVAMHSALAGQDARQRLHMGDDALASGLWEVAALHYDYCLRQPELGPEEKSRVGVRLAEAWVRQGKPKDALDLLQKSFVSGHPEAPFWQGQALVASGRLADAITVLNGTLEVADAPFRTEAVFTIENLQLALGQPDAAIVSLSGLAAGSDAALAAKAKLHQAEILIDLGQAAKARDVMPEAQQISQPDRALATFIEARLALAENRPKDAIAAFQSLVDDPRGQSSRRYQLAAIGLADSLSADGKLNDALSFLMNFIQEYPESPELDSMFQRLAAWMPEVPTMTDPVLSRLAQWITPTEIPAAGLIASMDAGAAGSWPLAANTTELAAQAIFTRAVGLNRVSSPEARAEARALLNRLRMEKPGHLLADRALFESARRALADGDDSQAFFLLDTLKQSSRHRNLLGKAAFLEAETAYANGDKAAAAKLFKEAADSLDAIEADQARYNAALSRFMLDPSVPMTVLQTELPENSPLSADLEIERALAIEKPDERRTAIEEFLTRNPQHPRMAEARLAAAEAALTGPDPDLSFARAQLDTLNATPEATTGLSPLRLAMVNLRIEDVSGDQAAAIARARALIEAFPNDPAAAEASLILGRNLFQTRSYNDARIVLEKLAAADADSSRAQAAWLLAARSAALVPTSQSHQEAIALFDKAIALKGDLTSIALLEKTRLMIDINRLAEAAVILRAWFDKLDPGDPLHLPAGLLLGEATYAQGGAATLAEALAVYDELLEHAEGKPGVFNRIQYLRGRTLEQIPDPDDPALKRESQAFVAYYSVLETTEPPEEWHYFELCGFRALALLEKAGRWPAAIACAKKIASFKGPRAEEANTRANQLQLKHMVWEE